ncbi:MAG: SAF domain-containing protein, partial [Candidatus Rokubacteria bacterium]|nr:SAF domain-containing protein [Candidatus Rokubacteria bacterium]
MAARTIPPYTTITADDITWANVPMAAVFPDDVQNPVGRVTTLGVAQGEVGEAREAGLVPVDDVEAAVDEREAEVRPHPDRDADP